MITSPSTESGSTTQVELIIAEKATEQIQNIASEIDAMIRRTESREEIQIPGDDKEKGVFIEATTITVVVTEKAEQKVEDKPEIESKEVEKELPSNERDHPDSNRKEKSSKNCEPMEIQPVSPTPLQMTIEEERPEENKIVVKEKEKINGSLNALRIVESEEEISEIIPDEVSNLNHKAAKTNGTGPDPYKNVVVEMEKYDVRYVPLKGSEESEDQQDSTKSSNGGAKTVKDIIDSINKSQSLLKLNSEERRTSNGSINTRIRELERKETECKEMLNEIDLDRKIGSLGRDEELEDVPVVIRELQTYVCRDGEEKDGEGSNVLFKKCRPTSGSHDWNPLPKPKRSSPAATPN